jgi:hypothetical protein
MRMELILFLSRKALLHIAFQQGMEDIMRMEKDLT